jgi:TonB family protein
MLKLLLPAMLILGLVTGVAAQPVAPSPAMAEAMANKDKIKVRARALSRLVPVYPATSKAASEAGIVEAEGIVLPDGSITEVTLKRSSATKALEASMLSAAKALRFTPAKDAAGVAMSSVVSLSHRFETDKIDAATLTWVEPVFDPAARAAGHNGKVLITGTIGLDGKLQDAKVTRSSRSPLLDAAALAAAQASVMRPFHDGAGKPITIPTNFPFEFVNYRSPGEGGGVLRYDCGQFARDEQWLKQVATGEKATDKGDFHAMMLGLGYIARGFNTDANAVRAQIADFDKRWEKAITTCAAQPKKLFVDVFKPEGEIAKRLAKSGK